MTRDQAPPPPYPTIRRLACTTFFNELQCSQDKTRVTVALDGTATCARGHLWLDQKDERGREPWDRR